MANAQLRIQVTATKARGTASMEDYLEGNIEGYSVSFCFPGNEIPEWFSHQHRGSAVVIKLPPHWCSTKFLGFALCVVAAFENCEYFNLCFNCKCYFLTKDGELYEIVCDLKGMKLDGRLGFQESDHVFLLYAHGLSTVFQRDDGEHNLSIYSSCQEALFEFSAVDKDLQPIPNCKIKKCGVHLLYLEEETTQICGDDSLNEAALSGAELNGTMEVPKHATPPERIIKTQKPPSAVYGSASSDRPYACPYEGCEKAYIHEYKLKLHLKREHPGSTPDEVAENATPNADNEMDEGSDQDIYVGKCSNGKSQKQSRPKPKLKMPPSKVTRRKGSSPSPATLGVDKTMAYQRRSLRGRR
ncbi:hypothetical protein LWI29_010801 [Acer saccharum]|uniref:C2H2-type domain-containing protein n=1 Tax=Acer saccharum TaxID=4024 RepID=A0AA39RVZ0_ACESA|nr:hypothetical protein LWI29_010801 [Acer saccharum]